MVIASEKEKPVIKSVTQERWGRVRDKIRKIGKQIGVTGKFTPTLFEIIKDEFNSESKELIHFI